MAFGVYNYVIKRCEELGCEMGAKGSTSLYAYHGGGMRCEGLECERSAAVLTARCITHGRGKRCVELGCDKSADLINGSVIQTWRRQAVRGGRV
jgi:hypothetical protein